jgi:hypothetical protein
MSRWNNPNCGFKKGHIPWNTGKKRPPFSEEWRRNISLANMSKGPKKISKRELQRAEKRRLKQLARENKVYPICKVCKQLIKHCGKKYCSYACSDKGRTNMLTKNCLICNKELLIRPSHYKKGNGRYCSRKCYGVYLTTRPPYLHPSWKGGLNKWRIKDKIRGRREYKLWKRAVKERDNFTCIWCGSKERIETDHIKPFCDYPELRFAIDNGRTLCHECHQKTESYGRHHGRA